MTREEIAVGRSAAERIIEALADLQFAMSQKDHDGAELALEIASTGARTLHVLINGAGANLRAAIAQLPATGRISREKLKGATVGEVAGAINDVLDPDDEISSLLQAIQADEKEVRI